MNDNDAIAEAIKHAFAHERPVLGLLYVVAIRFPWKTTTLGTGTATVIWQIAKATVLK